MGFRMEKKWECLQKTYNIPMFRKNCQERTHSAGARVASSKKIPADFFTPNKKNPKQTASRGPNTPNSSVTIPFAKRISDSMLFTFNRQNSSKQLQTGSEHPKLKKTPWNKVAKFSSSTFKDSTENSRPEQRENRLMKASRADNKLKNKMWLQIQ